MAKIRMTAQPTLDAVEEWVNENNFEYDSIQIKADDCNNSSSGIIFTAWAREAEPSDENSNCNIPHVSNPVNCAICGRELTDSEKKSGGNCCDLCWLSN